MNMSTSEWRKELDNMKRAALALYRMGHARDDDFGCELSFVSAPVLDLISERQEKLEKAAAMPAHSSIFGEG